ncbi:hypothetical protein Gpo141_00000816 [Globisporangium polare]
MKFPLTERIVPALALSAAEREHYEKMAGALVDDTISQYDEYDRVYHRQVNKEQWKAVKRREHLTVYKERKVARPKVMLEPQSQAQQPQQQKSSRLLSRFSTAALPSPAGEHSSVTQDTVQATAETRPFASTTKWTVPTLFMVGTIVGTLDDVMYGVATFDGPSMVLKTTYTHDELADGEILNEIHGPTAEDPFRFLGIKWVVKGNPAAVSKFVRPRDLVFLEATGVRECPRGGGDRIGYHLMHSLDLPGYGPLQGKAKEILRGRVSSCIVFKQLSNGTVDVYMKANFEPNGKVTEPVAVLSAANGLIYCWRSVHCAQHKKLAWLLAAKKKQPRGRELKADSTAVDLQSLRNKCNTCSKTPHAFRQMTPCPLCAENMCSTCRVPKKLSYVGDATAKFILQKTVPFCKRCISGASQLSAFEVAKDEVLSGMWAPGGSDSSTVLRTASVFELSTSIETTGHVSLGDPSSSLQQDLAFHGWSASLVESEGDDIIESDVDACTEDDVGLSTPAAVGAPVSSLQAAEARQVELVALEQLGPRPSVAQQTQQQPQARPMGSSQEELYVRIAQLRDTAESVYQITMNTTAMHMSSSIRSASIVSPDASSNSSNGTSSSRDFRRVGSFRG